MTEHELDEHTITDAVIDSLQSTEDPRLREISVALVRHLHDFVREVELTPDEWMDAIRFLTRVGQTCSPTRQEFILLSDTLGVSMLVDMLAHRHGGDITDSTVLGPFYVADAPQLPLGADIAGDATGQPLHVEGSVHGSDGSPLAGASVETWQSDSEGYYDVQLGDELRLRARFTADDQGRFHFRTIVPNFYPIPDDGPVGDMLSAQGRHPYRPAHLHFRVNHPGHEELVTHLFVDGDPYLDSDVVFGVRRSLVKQFEQVTADPEDGNAAEHAYLSHDFVLARVDEEDGPS